MQDTRKKETNMKTLTYEEWVEKYSPIQDTFGDTLLFETFGKDLIAIRLAKQKHVWTIIDTDEEDEYGFTREYVVAGMHLVNRMNYVLTSVPWEKDNIQAEW